ncbi:MAG: hypothetical protein SFX72_02630 [Isosphaeraceae bacterium]|nr:hypothetical protein [Isosphaeraceae bacterium]
MSIGSLAGVRLLFAGGGLFWIWLIVGGAALGLLVVLYRAERRLVSRASGLALLGLRILAAAMLVLALFEPIVSWSETKRVRGRVFLAADVSESMDTLDGDPDRKRSRLEEARRLVSGPLAPLAVEHDVVPSVFASGSSTVESLEALVGRLAEAGRSPDPPRGETNPSSVLDSALGFDPRRPVLGVVLLTDGRLDVEADAGRRLERLRSQGIPVHSVLLGSTVPPDDLAIAALRSPDTVYAGDVATIEVTLKADGLSEGTEVEVELSRSGSSISTRRIQLQPGGGRPTLTFPVPMKTAGVESITAEARVVSKSIAFVDARPENDRRETSIQVVDDKATVLLIDAEARWEFRYLRNALARDERVELEAVLLRQPDPIGSITPTYATTPLAPSAPDQEDPLHRFDLIILGDVTPSEAGPTLWPRISKYVGERGGTLAIIPGPRAWPSLPALNETVRSLIPLQELRRLPAEKDADPRHPSLPPGVAIEPSVSALKDETSRSIIQLGSDDAAGRGVWSGLPRLPWVIGGPPKPTASTLLVARDGTVVSAVQPFGLGRVLFLGTESTWRWRLGVGDLHHHRFWGQVVRWGASRALPAGDRYARFGPDRARIEAGQSPIIRARISEAAGDLPPDLLPAARIFLDGQDRESAIVPLRRVPGQPRTFEGTAPAPSEGTYRIELEAPGVPSESNSKKPSARLVVTGRQTAERIELSASRDSLYQLAAATSGRVFEPTQISELIRQLETRVRSEVETGEIPIWDHPVGLLGFLAVLTAEWLLRRRVGLP